jgi:hypothetical protein
MSARIKLMMCCWLALISVSASDDDSAKDKEFNAEKDERQSKQIFKFHPAG